MDVDSIRIFADIARAGNFAAVARERGVEPSSISRAISALEASLGFRLFQRSTRKVALSEAGALYLSRIESALSGLDAAREEARALSEGPTGVLRLTASVTFGLIMIVPLLPEFRAAFSRLALELELTDQNLDLVADRIDLAVRLAPSYRGDVIGVKAFDIRYRVCAAPSYLSSTARIERPADLAEHRCILLTLPQFRNRWIFGDKAGVVAEAKVGGDLVISAMLAVRAAALRGLGPALLPHWLVCNDLRTGALIDVFRDFDVTATDFTTAAWLLYPSRRHMPLKTRAAIDFFKSRLRSLAEG
ncbi:MAG TPA: LysR family transcriptional regulator [Roseiarcus sp.]|nr:LysR family transcriptional regulator [Roseiarcus sp.]